MKKILIAFLSLILVSTMTAAEMPLIVFGKAAKSSSEKSTETSDDSKTSKADNASSEKKAKIDKEIEENQEAISAAENEKKQINDNIAGVQAIISGLESKKGDLEGYVSALDSSLAGIQSEISGLNLQIDELDDKIDEIKKNITGKKKDIEGAQIELDEAQAECDRKYEETKEHIKYMYEKRSVTYLDVIFSSEGIQDLYNKTEYVNSLAKYDSDQIKEYAQIKEKVKEKKEHLQDEEKSLEEMETQMVGARDEVAGRKDEVKEKEAGVKTLIEAKEQEINAYEADITSKEAQIKEYQDMIAAQDAVIKSLEAAIAASRAQLSEGEEGQGPRTYDGGQFAFPAPSYTRISDDYGNRIHPTLGVKQFHNGVDLAAPNGSPILAAYDGEVIAADYSSTMGNYIMIDHGGGLFTIYMHSSSLLVSKGATVSRGQKIALVGSTGRSTGPHLHFSVRQNGNYVSPWNFLK